MRRYVFPALFLALSLTGCRTLWDPTFMPAGYTYHHEEYKAPPGPDAPDIGYEYSAKENEAHLMTWRYALRDLLMKARARDLALPQEFNLVTDLDKGAFQASYDHILREGLREYGYKLSESPDAPKVFYSAYDPDHEGRVYSNAEPRFNDDAPEADDRYFKLRGPKSKKMILVFGVLEGGKLTREERGDYDVPLYGYAPGRYVPDSQNPIKEHGTAGKQCATAQCAEQCHEAKHNGNE